MARQRYRHGGNGANGHDWSVANKQAMTLDARGLTLWQQTHVRLNEDWQKKPGVNADIASSSPPTDTIANRDFEVLGGSAVTADVVFRVGGGITLSTHGGANTTDSTIIAPHLDTNQTAWAVASWLTQKSVRFEAVIEQSASIAAQIWWCGLKLTNVDTIATDDDQIYFRFDTTSTLGATKLHLIHSRAGVDIDDVLPITIAASTQYRLVIEIDSLRFPHVYVNGQEYTYSGSISGATGPAKLTAISLIPYTGVIQTVNSTAKSLSILPGYNISRVF